MMPDDHITVPGNVVAGNVLPGGIPPGAPEWTEADPFYDVQKAASMTECTGLMPSMAQTDFEGDALARIESIHRIPGKNDQ